MPDIFISGCRGVELTANFDRKFDGASVIGEKSVQPGNLIFLKGEPMFQFFLFCTKTGYWPALAYLEMMPSGLIDTAEFTPG
jgi:hypothetical protein